jgi:hypothetical protein
MDCAHRRGRANRRHVCSLGFWWRSGGEMPYIVREVCCSCVALVLLMCCFCCGHQVERYPVHLSQQPQKEAHPPTQNASVKSSKNRVGTWGKQENPTLLSAPQSPPPSSPLYQQEGAEVPIMEAGVPGMELFQPTSSEEKLRWQEQQAVLKLMRAAPATSTSLQVEAPVFVHQCMHACFRLW